MFWRERKKSLYEKNHHDSSSWGLEKMWLSLNDEEKIIPEDPKNALKILGHII